MNSSLSYGQCLGCRQVRLGMKKERCTINETPMTLYVSCQNNQEFVFEMQRKLPVWFDDKNQIQLHLPSELLGLRKGKKLLIQRINFYFPFIICSKNKLDAKDTVLIFTRTSQESSASFPICQKTLSVCKSSRSSKMNMARLEKFFVIQK